MAALRSEASMQTCGSGLCSNSMRQRASASWRAFSSSRSTLASLRKVANTMVAARPSTIMSATDMT